MEKSKTIQTITDFYSASGLSKPTPDDMFLVYYFESELAKSIIREFGADRAKKLSKIILSIID